MTKNAQGRPRKFRHVALPKNKTKRAWINLRCSPELRERLEAAARISGRPMAAEVEVVLERALRDERSFEDNLIHVFGKQGSGMVQILGRLMKGKDTPAGFVEEDDWLADPTHFAEVRGRITRVLDAFAPPGEAETEAAERGALQANHLLACLFVRNPPAQVAIWFRWGVALTKLLRPSHTQGSVPIPGFRKRKICRRA